MKVIITGASGFVGQNVSKYFNEKKINVFAISMRKEWDCPKDADAIIHLAGKAHDTEDTSFADEYFKVNTELTKKIFNYFLHSDIKDFIYFSSVKAVADAVEDILYETQIAQPQTSYGKSKLLAEEYLFSCKLPDTKRVFIIRPCMIHGPGNKGNLNLLYKIVKKGIPWPLAAFENKRSFLSIDNLNFLLLELLKNKEIRSGIYNFADDDFLSTNELVEIIDQAIGKTTLQLRIYPSIIKCVSKIGDKLKISLNSERLKKLTENYKVSNQKIKDHLKIRELPTSTKKGLIKTIKSFEHK